MKLKRQALPRVLTEPANYLKKYLEEKNNSKEKIIFEKPILQNVDYLYLKWNGANLIIAQ